MSFIELYNRSTEVIELVNDYQDDSKKSLGRLVSAYKNGTLAAELNGEQITLPPNLEARLDDLSDRVDTISQTEARLNELADRVDTLTQRAEGAVNGVEFPARRIGPSPLGGYHSNGGWGNHFKTTRPLHFGRATVDAEDATKATFVLGHYDGKDTLEPITRKTFDLKKGPQRINLNMQVPNAGGYLLYRDGTAPLLRGVWDGFGVHSRDGLELVGGSKVGDQTKPNRYWYFFFDLQVAARADAHLPEPAALTELYP